MKKGFILLEVLIAIAISSFLLVILTNVQDQVSLNLRRINRIASREVRVLLMQNQMEKDLSGAFVPLERKEKKEKKKDKKPVSDKSKKNNKDENKNKKPDDKNKKPDKKDEKQYEDVPLKDAFLSKNKGGMLDELTFVTTNPVNTFIPEPYALAKPRIARVVYRLEQVKPRGQEPPSFRLLRQEDKQLDFGAFSAKGAKSIRAYELIKNIKNIKVEYTVLVKPKQSIRPFDELQSSPRLRPAGRGDQGDDRVSETSDQTSSGSATGTPNSSANKKDEQEQKPEYKKFKQWTKKEIEETKKQKPDFCVFTVELWEESKKTFDDFSFSVYILQPFIQQPKATSLKKTTTGRATTKGRTSSRSGGRSVRGRPGR